MKRQTVQTDRQLVCDEWYRGHESGEGNLEARGHLASSSVWRSRPIIRRALMGQGRAAPTCCPINTPNPHPRTSIASCAVPLTNCRSISYHSRANFLIASRMLRRQLTRARGGDWARYGVARFPRLIAPASDRFMSHTLI
uniref:Uncharacterized protein n=1 Tax=Plectus sambesii TaxID=2011161 RepID=A0A914VB82_9BILA